MKYVIITGGVMSGLGKGITAASMGRILKNKGYEVTAIKIDPYLNIDAGTMSPFQHGEVFVLKDGGEVDLDLGNYERFLDIELTREHNITTGKVYQSVINKERKGDYLGKTVQIIPHVTNEIKAQVREIAKNSQAQICLIEVGGTVGDIESMPFLEAVRQLHNEEASEDVVLVHITLVPMDIQGEQKTKLTQHSVKELRKWGLRPNLIVTRCVKPVLPTTKEKIALFCDVPAKAVISAHDSKDIFMVPEQLENEGAIDYLLTKLRLTPKEDNKEWSKMVEKMNSTTGSVDVAIVGKYTNLEDSYLSIREALKHAAIGAGCRVNIHWLDAEEFEGKSTRSLTKYDGILVPGGFGVRGTEGKIAVVQYARENNIPYLGLCLGMQIAVIEFARNVLGYEAANSSELSFTEHPVIAMLPEQEGVVNFGATMRLGDYSAEITPDSLAHKLYNSLLITERHRHRYEVNPKYINEIEKAGMKFTGRHSNKMEIVEIPEHIFFFASQFHPEFKSRPNRPSPPFLGFIEAMY